MKINLLIRKKNFVEFAQNPNKIFPYYVLRLDKSAELQPRWPKARQSVEHVDERVLSLLIALLFLQNQALKIQVDVAQSVLAV